MTGFGLLLSVAKFFFYGGKWTTQTPTPAPFSLPYVMPTKCQLLPYETPMFMGYIVFKPVPSANPSCACTSHFLSHNYPPYSIFLSPTNMDVAVVTTMWVL